MSKQLNRFVQPNVSQHYKSVSVESAGHAKRVCMLHDKFLEFVNMAQGDSSSRRRYLLDRAQNILAQLMASTVKDDNLGKSLFYLYQYAYARLERGTLDDCDNTISAIRPISKALSARLSGALS